MSIDWKKINDNIVNVGSILAKFIDTEVPQDVSFVLVKDDGDIENVTLKNLAYHLAKIKQNAVDVNTVEDIIKQKGMTREDIEKYVNNLIGELTTALKASSGDTSKISELLSSYYNKEDVDNIIDNLRTYYASKLATINTSVTELKNEMTKVNKLLVPELISDNTLLESGKEYTADTSVKAFTVTLPGNPNDNDVIYLFDGAYNAQNNNITVQRNGKTINGKDEDLICDVNGFYIILRFDGNKNGWYVANAVTNGQ